MVDGSSVHDFRLLCTCFLYAAKSQSSMRSTNHLLVKSARNSSGRPFCEATSTQYLCHVPYRLFVYTSIERDVLTVSVHVAGFMLLQCTVLVELYDILSHKNSIF